MEIFNEFRKKFQGFYLYVKHTMSKNNKTIKIKYMKNRKKEISLCTKNGKNIDDKRIILEIFFYKFYPTIEKFCNVENRLETW